jgi:MoaA/NifB/PqqE/SkfB family radical SAM enzyme
MREDIILAKNILLSNVKDLSYPYKLTLCLTYWCNFKCKTCNIWQKHPKDEMTLQDYENFFKKNNSFSWLDLTGGEIFLRKDIKEILLLIVKHCRNLYELHFPTNGSMAAKVLESVDAVLEKNPRNFVVTISLDGPEEKHNEVRGFPNSFRKCVDLYKQLKKKEKSHKNFRVYFGFTMSVFNVNELDNMYKQLKSEMPNFSYKDIHVNIFHHSDHYYSNDDVGFPGEEIIHKLKEYRALRGPPKNHVELLEDSYQKLVPEFIRTGKTPIVCEALSGSCFIDSWGDVYPCIIYNKKIGNILKEDLKDIWRKHETRGLRKEIKQKKCPNCWTPCEAYQSILAHSGKFAKTILKN